MPKKVAMAHAHRGLRGWDSPAAAGGTPELLSGATSILASGVFIDCIQRRAVQDSESESSGVASRIDSSISDTGELITYWPLAHFPRSILRQRSLQKGKSAELLVAAFLQIGQRSFTELLRGMGILRTSDSKSDFRLRTQQQSA